MLLTGNRTGNGGRGANSSPKHDGGGGSEGGSGGGIYNDGSLSIYDSTISKNFTGNGGNGGDGGAGEFSEEPGHFPNGLAGGGGAAAGDGGGIYNAGSALIEGSTISGNFTGRGGTGGTGGIGAGEGKFGAGTGGDGGDGGNSGKQYRKDQGTYWDERGRRRHLQRRLPDHVQLDDQRQRHRGRRQRRWIGLRRQTERSGNSGAAGGPAPAAVVAGAADC